MTNGVIYLAEGRKHNGTVDCLEEAIRSATSLKSHSPNVPTCLWTDEPVEDSCFDEVQKLSDLNARFHGGCWLQFVREKRNDSKAYMVVWHVRCGMKLMAMVSSPFDNTLYLDTDTYILNPVEEIFENDCDFGIAFEYPKSQIMNTGVVLLKGEKTRYFVHQWYRAWHGIKAQNHDQAVLPVAMQQHGKDLHVTFLDWRIWNVRPHNVGNGDVPREMWDQTIILHSRGHTPEQFLAGA